MTSSSHEQILMLLFWEPIRDKRTGQPEGVSNTMELLGMGSHPVGTITQHKYISSLVRGSCTLNLGAVVEHLTAQE